MPWLPFCFLPWFVVWAFVLFPQQQPWTLTDFSLLSARQTSQIEERKWECHEMKGWTEGRLSRKREQRQKQRKKEAKKRSRRAGLRHRKAFNQWTDQWNSWNSISQNHHKPINQVVNSVKTKVRRIEYQLLSLMDSWDWWNVRGPCIAFMRKLARSVFRHCPSKSNWVTFTKVHWVPTRKMRKREERRWTAGWMAGRRADEMMQKRREEEGKQY